MVDDSSLNDEYQLADLDAISAEPTPSFDEETTSNKSGADLSSIMEKFEKPEVLAIIKRAAVFLTAMIIIWIIYKVAHNYFSSSNEIQPVKSSSKVASVTSSSSQAVEKSQVPVFPKSQTQAPVQQATQAVDNVTSDQLSQKLSALELSQRGARSDMLTINNQLTSVNNNLAALSEKMSELNQVLSNLSDRIESQAEKIERMRVRTAISSRPKVTKHAKGPPPPQFYLQAIIPGRAWLMSTDGTTVTVREGSVVKGLGVIKLIDPLEGRVVTTNNKVIQFSQQDS